MTDEDRKAVEKKMQGVFNDVGEVLRMPWKLVVQVEGLPALVRAGNGWGLDCLLLEPGNGRCVDEAAAVMQQAGLVFCWRLFWVESGKWHSTSGMESL